MNITRIAAKNFMGVRSIELAPPSPLLFVGGANGAGKSSLVEAVRAALVCEIDRVKLKKEYGALVTEGEKVGSVIVEHAGGRAMMNLPTGKHAAEGEPAHFALPFVLDPHRFASLDENERRSFLFKLIKVSTSGNEIACRLVSEMGCSLTLVDEIRPMLASGFDAAHKHAASKATEARGAWKATTGEGYGSQKAEVWKAPDVEPPATAEIEAAQHALQDAEREQNEAQRTYGRVEAEARAYTAAQGKMEALRAEAGKIDRIRDKLARDEAEYAIWKGKLDELPPEPGTATVRPPMACPDCGSMLALHDGALHAHVPGKVDDAEIAIKRAERKKAVEMYDKSVSTGRRDLAAAERAKVELAELEAMPPVDDGAITAARAAAHAASEKAVAARQVDQAIRSREKEAADAQVKNANAAKYHAEVVGWTKLAEALSPAGLPVRIVADAIDPFNAALSKMVGETGWRVPLVGADMGITASGRQYRLLSEAERWMVDTVIALAIAQISGLRLAIIDRFDVLHSSHRGAALYLLSDLVEDGVLDQAIVAGTLKEPPKGLPEHWSSVWVESGYVATREAEMPRAA